MGNIARLKAQGRAAGGKGAARKLRAAGRVPAVVYGRGEQTRALTLDKHELEVLFSRVHYENTVITLDIEGEPGEVKALVREVQSHPYKPDILHVDFYQIHAGEKVTVEVPIRLRGTAPGLKVGGVLMHVLTDVELRCLPDQIPEFVEADVSALDVGDAVHVGDLQLPAGVEAVTEQDRVVVAMAAPTVAAEVASDEGESRVAEPEVIRRGKEEEEA